MGSPLNEVICGMAPPAGEDQGAGFMEQPKLLRFVGCIAISFPLVAWVIQREGLQKSIPANYPQVLS